MTILVGMTVVGVHRWDCNRRHGGQSLLDIGDTDIDNDPSFLNVRNFANLIARGLRKEDMQYHNKPRFSHPLRKGQRLLNDTGSALIRIMKDGHTRRRSGKKMREYMLGCFVCRKYQQKQVNTMWCCKFCEMPLCKLHRGRSMSCEVEHVTTLDGPIACKGPAVDRLGYQKMRKYTLMAMTATMAKTTGKVWLTATVPSFRVQMMFNGTVTKVSLTAAVTVIFTATNPLTQLKEQ